MSGEVMAFIIFSLIAIVGGLLMVTLKNMRHMLIALVFVLLSIAGIYLLLSAEFLAVVHVLIYSGAMTVVLLYRHRLTHQHSTEKPLKNGWRGIVVFLGVAGLALVVYLGVYNLNIPVQPSTLHEGNTKQVGLELTTKYIIPFVMLIVLVLVAVVGSIILAKKEKDG